MSDADGCRHRSSMCCRDAGGFFRRMELDSRSVISMIVFALVLPVCCAVGSVQEVDIELVPRSYLKCHCID